MSTTLLEMRRSGRRPARGRPSSAAVVSTHRSPAQTGDGGGGTGMAAGHVPVLADELLQLLDPQPGQTAIDCTFGDGGHARLVAQRLGTTGTLIAIDRDPLAEGRFAALG